MTRRSDDPIDGSMLKQCRDETTPNAPIDAQIINHRFPDSNTQIVSTCAVFGNRSTAPISPSEYSASTSTRASRASVATSHDT